MLVICINNDSINIAVKITPNKKTPPELKRFVYRHDNEHGRSQTVFDFSNSSIESTKKKNNAMTKSKADETKRKSHAFKPSARCTKTRHRDRH